MRPFTAISFALALAVAAAPLGHAAAAGKNVGTVCITYRDVGFGCATGEIDGSPPTNCASDGCDVTLRAKLVVTPVACGWLERGNLHACAVDAPAFPPEWTETIRLPAGTYVVRSDLCVTDPTLTYMFPCEELTYRFVVPASGPEAQTAWLANLLDAALALVRGDDGDLVYASGTFRVHHAPSFD